VATTHNVVVGFASVQDRLTKHEPFWALTTVYVGNATVDNAKTTKKVTVSGDSGYPKTKLYYRTREQIRYSNEMSIK